MIDADAVLLDLYDTLAWTEWPELRDLMCTRIGVGPETLLRAFDMTRPDRGQGRYDGLEEDWAAVLDACGVDPAPSLVAELIELERDFLVTGVKLHDDSLPTLRGLRAKGIQTAVVSNCSRSTRGVVDRLGLEDEVDAVILSFEVGSTKPDPAIYRAALGRLEVAPERAVFVDDQARYCDGARSIGIRSFLIIRDGAAPIEGRARGEDRHTVIRDLRPLLG